MKIFDYRIFDPGSYPKFLKHNLLNFSYSNKHVSKQLKIKRIITQDKRQKFKILFINERINPSKVVKIANPHFYQQNVARPHGLAKGVHCLCGLSRCRKLKAAGSQRLHPPNRGSLHHLRSYLLFKGSMILNPKNYCLSYRP